MRPHEINAARQRLGLTLAQMAGMLDTDDRALRRYEAASDKATHRAPPPRLVRLLQAYLAGYRPADWPGNDGGACVMVTAMERKDLEADD